MSAPTKTAPAPRRQIGARQLEFLALGTAIGSGLFVGSAQALRSAGPSLLLAYAGCALAVYVVARALGEMALAFPGEESFVHHIRRELGPGLGLLSGWGFWFALVLIGMAELTAVGLIGHAVVPGLPPWVFAAAAVLLLGLVNLAPAGVFGAAEVWMSSLKIGVIFVFIGLGVLAAASPGRLGLAHAGLSNLWSPGGVAPGGWRGFARSLPPALFAFGGFELISLAAAETRDPERAVPRAVNGLLLRFVIFYLGGTSALLVLLPWNQMTPGVSPFLVVLQRLHTPGAAVILAAVLVSCILSSCNALLFGAARTLRVLARQGAAPTAFGALSGAGVPVRGVAFSALLISAAVLLDAALPRAAFGVLMELVALVTLLNWSLILLAELGFRRRGGRGERPAFAVPASPWPNLAALVFLALVLAISIAGYVNPGV